jgi:hypothetical protein
MTGAPSPRSDSEPFYSHHGHGTRRGRADDYVTDLSDLASDTPDLSCARRLWARTPRSGTGFLGFTFRARAARTKHATMFVSLQPAIAQNKIRNQIRRWRLHRWIGLILAEIARQMNPVVRGWMQYYGAFYRSALIPSCRASMPT